MALLYVCDGCERTSKLEFKSMGIEQLTYCQDCVIKVQEFIDARDELHNKILLDWKTGLQSLYDASDLKLPDNY